MKNKVSLIFIILAYVGVIFASESRCLSKIKDYKIVKNSVFPFAVDKEKACFFAFYTTNPDPFTDARGNGNMGDSLWYAYYKIKNPSKIHEFPKPPDTLWASVCSLEAVSFRDINGDEKREVTVIGSCDKNAYFNTYPFVFMLKGNKYVLDTHMYYILHAFIGLTVDDIQAYIKKPNIYENLRTRYNPEPSP